MSNFIIHIVPDDKFIDMAMREFDAVAPGIHRAIIPGAARPLQFISSAKVTFLSLAQIKTLAHSPQCTAVIFHSLTESFLAILKAIPQGKTAIWLGWGYDYYSRLLSPAYPAGLLMSKTKALMQRAPDVSPRISLAGRVTKFLRHKFDLADSDQRLLNKFAYFSPVIETEYALAKQLNPWFGAQHLAWNYGTVEDDFSSALCEPDGHGQDVLVGNSATPENNHIDLFEMLGEHQALFPGRIFAPLNYGNEWYKEQVICAGRSIFGSRFHPITSFLPKDEYIALLNDCGFVFMNHVRQQALGNICIMMLKGARIYLNQSSPLYAWFREQGAFVSPITEATAGGDFRLEPLDHRQIIANRDIVRGNWGRNRQREKTRRLIEIAGSHA